ncbi:MAG TPA: molybdenum cofactor guanylyltransferase [Bacteroidota bacterium]|nr:molybdenum cofactor guanylyltransferase [Bacteroidota bacterium]
MILAGGKSARMGSDKALLRLGGTTFIETLARTLGRVVDGVVISAGEPGKYEDTGIPVIPDVRRNCGPLGGIHAALLGITTARALVVACDFPLVSAEECARILAADPGADVVIGRCAGRLQPLFAVYSKTTLPVMERRLDEGRYSVRGCLDELNVAIVELADRVRMSNINTPRDYSRLRAPGTAPAVRT